MLVRFGGEPSAGDERIDFGFKEPDSLGMGRSAKLRTLPKLHSCCPLGGANIQGQILQQGHLGRMASLGCRD